MLKIESGVANDLGTKFWEIADAAGVRLTEFNHTRFETILSGTPVYFLDLDLDPQFCENVQAAADVDRFVVVATPPAGFEPVAESGLRLYIMAALLHALTKQGTKRQAYLQLLEDKMKAIAADADEAGGVVNIALLQAHGVVA